MPQEINSKTQRYISIAIKKIYLMFLKCKQTQPACMKNER